MWKYFSLLYRYIFLLIRYLKYVFINYIKKREEYKEFRKYEFNLGFNL